MNTPHFKVAIIEDEPSILEMYRLKLENSGYSVKTATNGKDGLTLIKQFDPDIVLLDLKMPYVSGEEMLSSLRSEPWGSNVHVIILTNVSKDEAPNALRFLHVDRYIVKAHHTPAQVAEIVKEVLAH